MFRTRIRELREASGYKSQQAFATAFGVAQTTVAGWEGGKREPGYETTMRLADFFGVSVDYLLGHKKEPTVKDDGLTEAEQSLISLFRLLPPDQQDTVVRIVQAATGK